MFLLRIKLKLKGKLKKSKQRKVNILIHRYWRVLGSIPLFQTLQAHMSTSKSFNFQKYIQRSLEDDFKVVVGIRFVNTYKNSYFNIFFFFFPASISNLFSSYFSPFSIQQFNYLLVDLFICFGACVFSSPFMWFIVVIFMLVDVHGQ